MVNQIALGKEQIIEVGLLAFTLLLTIFWDRLLFPPWRCRTKLMVDGRNRSVVIRWFHLMKALQGRWLHMDLSSLPHFC